METKFRIYARKFFLKNLKEIFHVWSKSGLVILHGQKHLGAVGYFLHTPFARKKPQPLRLWLCGNYPMITFLSNTIQSSVN